MKKILITLLLTVSAGLIHGQTWLHDMEQAVSLAKVQQKFILIDFYADWCGPCKELDANTWNKPEVVEQLHKLVTVKINIDYNKALASRYGIKAIPHIFIIDPWENRIFDIEGFQSAYSMEQLLQDFPEQVVPVMDALQKLEDNNDNPALILNVAIAYQNTAKTLGGKGQEIFLSAGDEYQAQAKRAYKKSDNVVGLERVELLECCGRLLQGNAKKAMKTLEKMGAENVHPENRALALFVASRACLELEDAENAKIFSAKLQQQEGAVDYVNELKTIYPDFKW